MKIINYAALFITLVSFTGNAQTNTPCSGATLNAPNIAVNTTCTYTTLTTVGATAQTNGNNGGTPSCGTMGEDVWMSFTAPASGDVTITTAAGGITDGVMALYSGSCGSWTELDCSDDVNASMPEISIATLTPGDTYLIRFWDYGGGTTGTFDLCVTENAAPVAPVNDDCVNALPLAVGVDEVCSPTSGTISGATDSGISSACFGTPDNDIWYSFIATDDTVTIDRTANFDSEIEIFDACGGTSIDCADAEAPLMLTTLTPGNTYYIRIYHYYGGDAIDPTFDICLYDPAPPAPTAVNVTCGSMEPICITNTIIFTAEASGNSAEPGNDYGCLNTQPDPTWYYMEVSAAGDLVMDLTGASDVDYALWGPYASLTAAQAACGSYPAPIDCSYSSSATEQATVTGAQVGEVYVMVVTNYAGVVQNITLTAAGANTAETNCLIVNCGADAGNW